MTPWNARVIPGIALRPSAIVIQHLFIVCMRQILPPPHTAPNREKWLVPEFMAENIFDIDFAALRSIGVRAVALDIDSTLVAHGGMELTPQAVAFLRRQRESGTMERLAVATNRGGGRLGIIASALEPDAIVYARFLRRKPARSYFEHLLNALGTAPEETAMVGDKLFADVLGANRAGLVTVLVEPLGPPAWFERLILHRWRQKRITGRYRLAEPAAVRQAKQES